MIVIVIASNIVRTVNIRIRICWLAVSSGVAFSSSHSGNARMFR